MADEFDPPSDVQRADSPDPDDAGFWFSSGPKGTVERNAARDVDAAMEVQGQSKMQREIIAQAVFDATDNKNLNPDQRRQAIKNLEGYQNRLGFRFNWDEWRRERRARGEKS